MTIPEILSLKFSPLLISGFRKGNFDETGTKFYAYSIFNVKGAEYEEISSFITSYGYIWPDNNQERYVIDNGDGTYAYKDLEQLLREEIFKFLAIQFHGILYKNDWYIKKTWIFLGHDEEENCLKQIDMAEELKSKDFWVIGLFENVPGFRTELNLEKLSDNFATETGQDVSLTRDWEKIFSYSKTIPYGERPMKEVRQFEQYEQFIGQPWLVAYEKEDIKHNLNKTFESYINEEIFVPLASTLKMQLPDEFHLVQTLMHERHFPLIYPNSKEQVLGILKAVDRKGTSRLYYFLYIRADKKIYEWTLPKPRNAGGHHAYLISLDIGDISNLKVHLHEPEMTFDDEIFWSEYVFKKDGDQYRYLKPIDICNPQPDIFTQW